MTIQILVRNIYNRVVKAGLDPKAVSWDAVFEGLQDYEKVQDFVEAKEKEGLIPRVKPEEAVSEKDMIESGEELTEEQNLEGVLDYLTQDEKNREAVEFAQKYIDRLKQQLEDAKEKHDEQAVRQERAKYLNKLKVLEAQLDNFRKEREQLEKRVKELTPPPKPKKKFTVIESFKDGFMRYTVGHMGQTDDEEWLTKWSKYLQIGERPPLKPQPVPTVPTKTTPSFHVGQLVANKNYPAKIYKITRVVPAPTATINGNPYYYMLEGLQAMIHEDFLVKAAEPTLPTPTTIPTEKPKPALPAPPTVIKPALPAPTTPAPPPVLASLSDNLVRLLRERFQQRLVDALGTVSAEAESEFEQELDMMKGQPYQAIEKALESLASDIIGRQKAPVGIAPPIPERVVEAHMIPIPIVKREERRPELPLAPFDLRVFPRAFTSEEMERIAAWFSNELELADINPSDYWSNLDTIAQIPWRTWSEGTGVLRKLVDRIKAGQGVMFIEHPPMPYKTIDEAVVHLARIRIYKTLEDLLFGLREHYYEVPNISMLTVQDVKDIIKREWKNKSDTFGIYRNWPTVEDYIEGLIGEKL